MKALTCQACGGQMKTATQSSGNCLGLAIGFFLVVLGVVITVATGGIGIVLGGPIALIGLFCGGKRQKIWKCRQCAAFFPRA